MSINVGRASLLFSGVLFILFTISIISTNSNDGYFITVWEVYHPIVWVLLALGLIFALIGTIFGVYHRTDRFWIGGVIITGCFYAVFFTIPRFLGLRFWAPTRTDMFSHFAHANMISSGNVRLSSYPLLHFLIGILSSISGTPPEVLHMPIILVSWFIFVSGIYLFAKSLFDERVGMWTVVALLPLAYGNYHYQLMPWFISFTFVPASLYAADRAYRRAGRFQNRMPHITCALILFIGVVLYHPMTALITIALLSVIVLVNLVQYQWTGGKFPRTISVRVVVILCIPFFIWFWWLGIFEGHVATIISATAEGVGGGATEVERAGSSGYTIKQLIWRIAVHQLGTVLIYVSLGGISSFTAAYLYFRRRPYENEPTLIAMYAAGLSLAIMSIFAYFITTNPTRVNQVTIFASIISIGYLLSSLSNGAIFGSHITIRNMVITFMVISLVLGSLLGVYNVYDNREHIIESELEGSEWVIDYANHDHESISRGTTLRMNSYLVGYDRQAEIGWDRQPLADPPYAIPRRLGHLDENELVDVFAMAESQSIYLITKERDRSWYQVEPENRHSGIIYYTNEDMTYLSLDQNSSKIYSNGEFEVWLVTN